MFLQSLLQRQMHRKLAGQVAKIQCIQITIQDLKHRLASISLPNDAGFIVSKLATNLKDGPNIGCKISTSILCENALFSVINAHILLQCWMLIKGFLKGLPWTGAKMACFRWHMNWRINKINKNYF